jgi:hypothetical protein
MQEIRERRERKFVYKIVDSLIGGFKLVGSDDGPVAIPWAFMKTRCRW